MVYFDNNQWNFSGINVIYEDEERLIKKSVGIEGKEWWLELERLWSNIKKVKFEEVIASDDQLNRLDRVNRAGIKDGFSDSVAEYVKSGKFPDGFSHALKDVEVEEVSQSQGVSLSEREIEALYLAIQISDLELQLLEIGGGI